MDKTTLLIVVVFFVPLAVLALLQALEATRSST
jgi:hypothetical protein